MPGMQYCAIKHVCDVNSLCPRSAITKHYIQAKCYWTSIGRMTLHNFVIYRTIVESCPYVKIGLVKARRDTSNSKLFTISRTKQLMQARLYHSM